MATKTKTTKADAFPPDGAGHPTAPEGAVPPPFGTPRPIAVEEVDADTDLPRVCDPLDRVPADSGVKRYKVRCDNFPEFGAAAAPRYVLAKAGDESGAERVFAEACGLNGLVRQMKRRGVKDVPEPVFTVIELPD